MAKQLSGRTWSAGPRPPRTRRSSYRSLARPAALITWLRLATSKRSMSTLVSPRRCAGQRSMRWRCTVVGQARALQELLASGCERRPPHHLWAGDISLWEAGTRRLVRGAPSATPFQDRNWAFQKNSRTSQNRGPVTPNQWCLRKSEGLFPYASTPGPKVVATSAPVEARCRHECWPHPGGLRDLAPHPKPPTPNPQRTKSSPSLRPSLL